MSRRCLLLLAATLVSLGAACDSEDDEIRSTITGYLDAVADRDGRRACGYLTENAQLGIFEFKLVHAAPDHPEEACAATIARRAPKLGATRLRAAKVDRITVDGDHATADVNGHEVELEKVDGAWRINVFGVATDVARDSASASRWPFRHSG